jgi:CRP-like cAMP-binding protein
MQECEFCAIRSKAVGTLNPDELDILKENCAEVTLQAGENIIKEGFLSSHVAYLKSGLAKISKKGVKGIDQILKLVRPGSYLGLQTVLSNKVHQYSASAVEESVICYIDIWSFKELIMRNAQFANELILYMGHDELSYFKRFVNVQQKQVIGRLADNILYFSNEINEGAIEFTIPLSRSDLAALVGATRESVTRAIKELSDIGTIRVNGKRFKILNTELLEKISHKG